MKNIILIIVVIVTAFLPKIEAQYSTDTSLQYVITAYLNVKNALVNDDGVKVRAAAKNLYAAIDKVPMEKLSSADHKVWMEYESKLSSHAEHMIGTDDIEHQREHFIKLSDNFYKMVKALNVNTADLYYQYCPMANDGKGAYWVSEQEGILNPYFGKKMLKCGSTKETIEGNH